MKKAYDGGTLDFTDHYYYNTRWQALEVRRDSGSGEDVDPREQYVWHPYYIDALATRFYDATMGGTQVQHYFTHDANFNVTAVIDTAGAVVERYHYTAHGELTVLNGGTPDSDGNEWTDDPDNKSDIAIPIPTPEDATTPSPGCTTTGQDTTTASSGGLSGGIRFGIWAILSISTAMYQAIQRTLPIRLDYVNSSSMTRGKMYGIALDLVFSSGMIEC